jgi:hypothetical protein
MEEVSRLRETLGERTRLRGAAAQERARKEAQLMAPTEAAAQRLFAHKTRPGPTKGDSADMRRLYEKSIEPKPLRWWERLPWWPRSTPFEDLRNAYAHRVARGGDVATFPAVRSPQEVVAT